MRASKGARIGQQLLAQRAAVALCLYALGVLAFLLLPLAARNIEPDEKALLFGGRAPAVRVSEWPLKAQLAAQQLVKSHWDSVAPLVNAAAATLPTGSLAVHTTTLPLPDGSNCSAAQAVAHSQRGDGLEALALLIPVDPAAHPWLAALAVSIALSAGQRVTAQPWLARDVVLAFVDSRCGRLHMAQAWLDTYHDIQGPFVATGGSPLLQQALVLELMPSTARTAALSVHGTAGQLPNLDMYWSVKRNWDLHGGFPTTVGGQGDASAAARWLAKLLGAGGGPVGTSGRDTFASGPSSDGSVGHGWAGRYAASLAHAVAFTAQQVAGGASGPHAAFLDRGIDSVTLAVGTPDAAPAVPPAVARREDDVIIVACLAFLEGLVRTLSNLEERLHHASQLYLLTSPTRVVPLWACLAPPGSLLAALLLQLWSELDSSPPASHSVWQTGWQAFAALQALTTLLLWGCCRWDFQACGTAMVGAVVVWQWSAALQSALCTSLPPGQQQLRLNLPAAEQGTHSSGEEDSRQQAQVQHMLPPAGSAGGGPLAAAAGVAAAAATAGTASMKAEPPAVTEPSVGTRPDANMDVPAEQSSLAQAIPCLLVMCLASLSVVGAGLLLGSWALGYATLLAGLTPMLCSWSVVDIRLWSGQQAGQAPHGVRKPVKGVRKLRRCLPRVAAALLGAAPAVLLALSLQRWIGPSWLSWLQPSAILVMSQVLVCVLSGLLTVIACSGLLQRNGR